MLSNFLIIPAVKEKFKLKLLLAIATGAPTTLINEMTDNPPVVVLKTIKILSMKSNAATYLLNFLLHDFLWLISWLKQFLIFHFIDFFSINKIYLISLEEYVKAGVQPLIITKTGKFGQA